MKGEAEEEEEEWAEGGGRGLVVGGWSFFRFLLAGAVGEAIAGEGPLLVAAACAVGGAAAEVVGVVLEAAVGGVVAGAFGLRGLRFFLAEREEEGAAGVGVEEDEAGSGRRGKKLSNIMMLGSQQRGGAYVCEEEGCGCGWLD